MQNYGISSGNNLNIWAKPIPLFCILHLSFCILLFETKFQTTIYRGSLDTGRGREATTTNALRANWPPGHPGKQQFVFLSDFKKTFHRGHGAVFHLGEHEEFAGAAVSTVGALRELYGEGIAVAAALFLIFREGALSSRTTAF